MVLCRSCGVTVAVLVQPNEPMPECDPVGVVLLGKRNGAPPRVIRALVELGGADTAGLHVTVPARMRAWATGSWVDEIDGAALTVLPAADPAVEDVPAEDVAVVDG